MEDVGLEMELQY